VCFIIYLFRNFKIIVMANLLYDNNDEEDDEEDFPIINTEES
jgi:hypothetical protein